MDNSTRHQKDLERLSRLRPIDDSFMRAMFKNNLPLAQFVLRILLNKPDLILLTCETQADMKRVTGARSICLDAYASDSTGKKYDIEIQRADHGAEPHRARYHSSIMDIENLNAGQAFDELPDTYTIFITETDFFNKGAALYPIDRMNLVTGESFNDGAHILYVNGTYRDDSEIGKLMHDFNCTQAEDMNYPLMAERTDYLKHNTEGVTSMCKEMEKMCDENTIENARMMIKNLNMTIEQVLDTLEIPESKREVYRKALINNKG